MTVRTMAEKETTVCVKLMQLKDKDPMCAFTSEELKVFRPLSLSLLCENRFFAFKTDVLHSQITGREGKNSNNSLGETLAGSAKVGTYHAC